MAVVPILSLSLVLTSPEVKAEDDDSGWYFGLGLTRADADFDDVSDSSFDESDDAWNIKGGYLETGYIDPGDYEGGDNINIDADAYLLAGIANWSVSERWYLYAKSGVAIVDAKSSQLVSARRGIS